MTDEQAAEIIKRILDLLAIKNKEGEVSDEIFIDVQHIVGQEISPQNMASDSALSRHVRELNRAKIAVGSVMGQAVAQAFDSASGAYAAGIQHLGGSTIGKHPDALESIFTALRRSGSAAVGRPVPASHPASRIQVL